MKLNTIQPARVRSMQNAALVVVSVLDSERPLGAVIRGRSRAPGGFTRLVSKAAKCRFSAGCQSVDLSP